MPPPRTRAAHRDLMSERPPDAEIPHGTLAEVGRELASRPYAQRGVPARIEPIRVMLVDDHSLVRAGLRAVLHASPDITVVGEAGDGQMAFSQADRARPDVIVMDLDMPGGDGLTATRRLLESMPDVRVLIVTMYDERDKLLPVLHAGARGYLSKGAVERELADAIRVVASGDVYVRPAVSLESGDFATNPNVAEFPFDDPLHRAGELAHRHRRRIVAGRDVG